MLVKEKKAPSAAQLAAREKFKNARRGITNQSVQTDGPVFNQPPFPQEPTGYQKHLAEIQQPVVAKASPARQAPKYDQKKRYHFQLMKDHTSTKGRDYDTGEVLDNPYPPNKFYEPVGTAINPDSGEIEHWRYILGYNSIWVKDQMKPEPTGAQLINPKNIIEFKNGSLFANGINTAFLDALFIMDVFEGVKNPLNPKPAEYRLVDPEKEMKQTMGTSDMRFEASKAAREAPVDVMLAVAMHFGINVDNPEADLGRIRNEFILRAESDPDNFNKQFTNPKNAFKYKITLALRDNLISTNVIPGKMVLTSTQRAYFDVKEGDSAEQFAQLVFNRVDNAVNLYHQIENLLVK